jgi:thiamine biosynthesis lipoprotein
MATVVEVTVETRRTEADASGRLRAALAAFEDAERRCSRFLPESELSQVNRDAPRGDVAVSAEFMGLLREAFALAAGSGGCFSPLLGPLVALWAEDASPSRQRIAEALSRCDPALVELDERRGTVRFHRHGVSLNLDGMAKGQATDRALAVLCADGVVAALVNAGGSSVAWFRDAGPAARIALRHPARADRVAGMLALPRAGALSTTGAHPPAAVAGEAPAAHVIDPRTGVLETRWASATVVCHGAALAEATAKMFLLMDHEDAAARCGHNGWDVKALTLDFDARRDELRAVHHRGLRFATRGAA